MKTKRRFFAFLLPVLALAALPAAAQQGPVFAPLVSRLEKKITDNRVTLSWVDSRDVRGPVYVYRSSLRFGAPELLAEITPVQIPYGTQTYADETALSDGNFSGPVYYFVAASDENGLRYDYPIINSNTIEVSASSGAGETVELPGEGEDGLKRPRVFVRDLYAAAGASGSGEYALASIVRGPFAERNWDAAQKELNAFLSRSPEKETKARARFYLGQCAYFLRRPEDGLFEFAAFQVLYPAEASGWITASLEMIGN